MENKLKIKDIGEVTRALDQSIFGDVDYNDKYKKFYNQTKYVHIIPHSHTDVGWLGTIDEYFYGHNLDLYKGSINQILSSVVEQLSLDPKRTFNYAEIKFFKMWWDLQSDENKNKLRHLVRNGQFNFVNAGMSAPDEATTNSDDIIDNFMRGHQFLANDVGIDVPNISWQVDSFGVSKGFARLAKDIGFQAMFFSRIDAVQKSLLADKKQKQVWRADDLNFGDQKDILSVLMVQESGNYCSPKGFEFDQNYNDKLNFEDGGQSQLDHLTRLIDKMLYYEESDHIFLTFGCDFSFTKAEINYKSIDYVMNQWNKQNSGIKMFYSSPQTFVNAIKDKNVEYLIQNHLNQQQISLKKKQNNLKTSLKQQGFSIKYDDSFPYQQNRNKYWSGFYTTRPHFKQKLRQTSSQFHSSLFQSSKLFYNSNNKSIKNYIIKQQQLIMENLGAIQHHDSITGTSKRRVAQDYFQRAVDIQEQIKNLNLFIFQNTFGAKQGLKIQQFDFEISNKNQDLQSYYQNTNEFLMIFQNPNQEASSQLVSVDIPYEQYKIYRIDFQNKQKQIVFNDNFRALKQNNDRNGKMIIHNQAYFPITFPKSEAYQIYLVQNQIENESNFAQKEAKKRSNQKEILKSDFLKAHKSNFETLQDGDYLEYSQKKIIFRGFKKNKDESDCVFEFIDTKKGLSQRFSVGPRFYQSQDDFGEGDGLYEFLPKQSSSFQYSQIKNIQIKKGKHIGQILLTYGDSSDEDYINQLKENKFPGRLQITIQLQEFSDFLKFDVNLLEIPVTRQEFHSNQGQGLHQLRMQEGGKDVVINWQFEDFDTDDNFWYDANGLQMVHKQLWKRKEFTQENKENIASNFYPIQSAIAIRDKNSKKQVTIMTEQCQGGSAGMRNKSNIELMINRRTVGWDGYGIPESLNDLDQNQNGIQINTSYYMQIFNTAQSNDQVGSLQRMNQKQLELPILKFMSKHFQFEQEFQETDQSDILLHEDSRYIKILNYALNENQFLIRISNMRDNFDNQKISYSFDLFDYLQKYSFNQDKRKLKIQETTLDGVTEKENEIQTKWATIEPFQKEKQNIFEKDKIKRDENGFVNLYQISLQPMDIRAFKITF